MAGSTCEAEDIAASEVANEGVWMKEFISDLGVIPSASGPMKMFWDSIGAIALEKESKIHKRTKHIKRCFNSIRDQVKEGDIEICNIHTDLNVADPLTKPLSRAKHDQHQDSSASGRLKEICPRGNNKVVIYISLYHDKCLLFMLELY